MAEKWPRAKLNKALESKTHLLTLLIYFMASGDKMKRGGKKTSVPALLEAVPGNMTKPCPVPRSHANMLFLSPLPFFVPQFISVLNFRSAKVANASVLPPSGRYSFDPEYCLERPNRTVSTFLSFPPPFFPFTRIANKDMASHTNFTATIDLRTRETFLTIDATLHETCGHLLQARHKGPCPVCSGQMAPCSCAAH